MIDYPARPPQKTYDYVIQGNGGDGTRWKTKGRITCEADRAYTEACRATFMALTQGKAEYGKPGQGGCRGPYDITNVEIIQVQK